MYIGQSESAALEIEGETFVIESEAVEDGRLEIVDVNGVLGHVEAEVVSRAEGEASSYATASKPHGVGLRVVIPSQGASERRVVLDHGSSTELASPDDQCGVQQSSVFQIPDECSRGLVGLFAVTGVISDEA